jgi:hypothetical protein
LLILFWRVWMVLLVVILGVLRRLLRLASGCARQRFQH